MAPEVLKRRLKNGLSPLYLFCALSLILALPTVVATPQETARAAAWLSPRDISTTGTSPSTPRVALSEDGDAVVAWLANSGGQTVLQATAKPAEGSWSAVETISSSQGSSSNPDIAIDSDGNATAVWAEERNTGDLIYRREWSPSTGWQTAVAASVGGQDASTPKVVLNAEGDGAIVWVRSDGANTIIQASVKAGDGSWQTVQDLSAAGTDANQPSVAVDPTGGVTAVWAFGAGSPLIKAAETSASSGTWSSPQTLSGFSDTSSLPFVAVDSVGGAATSWIARTCGAGNPVVQAVTRTAGVGWSSRQSLSASTAGNTNPHIALDPTGDATAAWDDGTGVIKAATKAVDAGWQSAQTLSASGAEAVDLITGSPGMTTATWQQTDSGNQTVQVATRQAGGDWSEAQQVSAVALQNQTPRVVTNSSDDKVVVWVKPADNTVQLGIYDVTSPRVTADVPTTGLTDSPMTFTATVADLTDTTTLWSFGDSTSATGKQTTHTYNTAGNYEIVITATDGAGNSTTSRQATAVSVGETPTTRDRTAPKITRLRATRKRISSSRARAAGFGITYRITEQATVKATVTRRKVRVKKGKRIRSYRRIGSFSVRATPGTNTNRIPLKLARKLTLGSYRITVTATDTAKNRSKVLKTSFTVVKDVKKENQPKSVKVGC